MIEEASTHLKVPADRRNICLGTDGSIAHVIRLMRMIQGRWKLPILFRLFADPSIRTSQLRRDMPDVSQKMLTQHLRELEHDRLIERIDTSNVSLRVDYRLSDQGRKLLPVLISMRSFSIDHADESAG